MLESTFLTGRWGGSYNFATPKTKPGAGTNQNLEIQLTFFCTFWILGWQIKLSAGLCQLFFAG